MKKRLSLLLALSGMVLTGCNFFATKETPTYQIVFKDSEGKVIETLKVEEGKIPNPKYEPTDTTEWDYSLVGWSKTKGGEATTLLPATESTTYYAITSKDVRKYTIGFYNEKGLQIDVKEYVYNAYPSCSYTGPQNDFKFTYTFKGWATEPQGEVLPNLPQVTENKNYFAIVDKEVIYYDISFYKETGVLIETKKYEYGATPSCSYAGPQDDVQYSYTFKGWSTSNTGTALSHLPMVTKSTSYYAVVDKTIKSYTASFYDEDGVLMNSSKFNYGSTPSYVYNKPSTSTTSYVFMGWSSTLGGAITTVTPITGDVSYYAVVEKRDPNSDIKLDSTNRYNSGVVTVKGFDGDYKFSYSGASYASGYHVKLNNSGSIQNSTVIKGAKSICVVFSGALSLSFGNSISTLSNAFPIESGKTYELGKYDTIFYIKASAATNVTSITISYGGAKDTNGSRKSSAYETVGIYFDNEEIKVPTSTSKKAAISTYPANATLNTDVTWSIQDTSVATISSTGIITPKTSTIGATTYITATNKANPKLVASAKIVISDKAEWTIMMYICGADLESKNGLASGDIGEILSVSKQPDDVNIIIQTGGASSWASTYGISASYSQRWRVENKTLVKDSQQSKVNMGLSSTFQNFLEWGLTSYPAQKTGVILWNHGGAMVGVCYDEQFGDDVLTNSEVKSAVNNVFASIGRTEKLEFIGYDACLMQVQDIAEFNSNYFNYMIASEESEAGEGWDYDTWVDDLYANKPTETILKTIVDGFITDNGGASSSRGDQTLSVLDLSKMSAYRNAWESMSSQINNKITSSNKSSFRNLINSAKHFADTDYDYFGTFDAKDFINKLAANSTFKPSATYTDAVLDTFDDLVIYSVAQKGAGNSYGLCMFFPISSSYSSYYNYSSSETNFSNWLAVCKKAGYLSSY